MYKIIQTVYTNYLNIPNNMPSMIYAIAQKRNTAHKEILNPKSEILAVNIS